MNNRHTIGCTPARQSGVSLLEVLVAILVLAVGLLGLAHMQATGLMNNDRAYKRSQATVLAYDIADRMRANPLSINNYLTTYMQLADAVAQAGCGTTSGCTSAEMAENDLFEWKAALETDLPDVRGDVAVTGTTYTVTINWDDNGDGAVDGSDPNFQVDFQP